MIKSKFRVLFVSTQNSLRSIIAESQINRLGARKFVGYSGGISAQKGIHTLTEWILQKNNFSTQNLASKNLEMVMHELEDELDFVFILDHAITSSSLPEWPGNPLIARWETPYPVETQGLEIEQKTAVQSVYNELERRISIFVNLPIESLDTLKLQQSLDQIGQS